MTALSFSNHALVRMAQRGIQKDDVHLIMEIATEVEDGLFVRRKDVARIERELKAFLKRLRRLEGKRMVVAGGNLVTAFHATHREQSRILKSH